MQAQDDNSTPSRSGVRRLISPWEYRHRTGFASARFASGGFTLGIGVVLLSLGRSAETTPERRKCYGWAAGFLTIAAVSFSVGYLDITVGDSAPSRTS